MRWAHCRPSMMTLMMQQISPSAWRTPVGQRVSPTPHFPPAACRNVNYIDINVYICWSSMYTNIQILIHVYTPSPPHMYNFLALYNLRLLWHTTADVQQGDSGCHLRAARASSLEQVAILHAHLPSPSPFHCYRHLCYSLVAAAG